MQVVVILAQLGGVNPFEEKIETGFEGVFLIRRQVGKGRIRYLMVNETFDIFDVTLKLVLVNFRASKVLPFQTIVSELTEAKDPLQLIELNPIDPNQKSREDCDLQVFRGDPHAVPDPSLYALPYQVGGIFRVNQAFGGNSIGGGKPTHVGKSRFAVDLDLPEGTVVTAARHGVVVESGFDNDGGGGHFIRVRHSDGTYGSYAHLQENGDICGVGAVVNEGEGLAHSGNTGESPAPHLHFDVSVADGRGGFKTVKWSLRDPNGNALAPHAGARLKSVPTNQLSGKRQLPGAKAE